MIELTVLMSVKDGEQHLSDCLNSIINQTYSNFELLLFDELSTDLTLDIVKSYKDKRITLIKDQPRLINNLNRGIQQAKGEYIALMKQDDIMDLTKLAIQMEVMEALDIDLCATWVYLFAGRYQQPKVESAEHGLLVDPLKSLCRLNFIHHSTVMLRRSFLLTHGLTFQDCYPAEDYQLWYEMARKKARFYVIPEPLVYIRDEADLPRQNLIIQQEICSTVSRRRHA